MTVLKCAKCDELIALYESENDEVIHGLCAECFKQFENSMLNNIVDI